MRRARLSASAELVHLVRVSYTVYVHVIGRLHSAIVGPTDGADDRYVQTLRPTGRLDDRKNQTCLISSDCRSDCRNV